MTLQDDTPESPSTSDTDATAIIDAFGGAEALAARLGIGAGTVRRWQEKGRIPASRMRVIWATAQAAGIDLTASRPAPIDTDTDTAGASQALPGADIPDEDKSGTGDPDSDAAGTARPDLDIASAQTQAQKDAPWAQAASAESPAADPPESDALKGDASPSSPIRPSTPAGASRRRGGWFAALVAVVVMLLALLLEPYWRPLAATELDRLVRDWAPFLIAADTPDTPGETGETAPVAPAVDDAARAMAARLQDGIKALSTRLDGLDARVIAAGEASGNTVDGEASAASAAAIAALKTDLAGLQDTLRKLDSRIAALSDHLSALDMRDGDAARAAATRLDALAARTTALEARPQRPVAAEPAAPGLRDAALLLEVGRLDDALRRGHDFSDILTRMARLGRGMQDIAAPLADLRPFADGVTTRAELFTMFREQRRAMGSTVTAAPADPSNSTDTGQDAVSGGAFDALISGSWGELRKLIDLRRLDDAPDAPPVSRAESALARDDLAGAVRALRAMTSPNQPVMDWLAAAESRLQALAAANRLHDAVIAHSDLPGGPVGAAGGGNETTP